MDRLKELFDLRGLKIWMLVPGFALNLILINLLTVHGIGCLVEPARRVDTRRGFEPDAG